MSSCMDKLTVDNKPEPDDDDPPVYDNRIIIVENMRRGKPYIGMPTRGRTETHLRYANEFQLKISCTCMMQHYYREWPKSVATWLLSSLKRRK